jgi:hypothetical protein
MYMASAHGDLQQEGIAAKAYIHTCTTAHLKMPEAARRGTAKPSKAKADGSEIYILWYSISAVLAKMATAEQFWVDTAPGIGASTDVHRLF